jgi:Protein of unknown function (DUF952)
VGAGPADRVVRAVDPRAEPGRGRLHALLVPGPAGGVAAAFYADADDLVLLRIDPALVPAGIRVEDGFPHIYGPLPVTAVTAAEPLIRDATGRLRLPTP